MSKCKIALLAGALIGLLVLTGCPSPANIPIEEKVTVTFELGKYAVQTSSNKSTFSTEIVKNTAIPLSEISIKTAYDGQLEIAYFTNKNTEEQVSLNALITSDITLVANYKASNVLNLNARQLEDKLYISWTRVQKSKYNLSYQKDSETPQVITDVQDDTYIIENVSSGEKYTISVTRLPEEVYTDIDNNTSAITKTITIANHSNRTEWLMLLYMDGDNNLNDPIYLDLNEVEYGLSQLPDNSSVRVIALWDGWDFQTGNDDEITSVFEKFPDEYTIKNETPATKLLDLGADRNPLYTNNGGIYYKACKLSSSTIDLTSTVDWIESNEVDMSSPTTLKNFLTWANEHYKADKIILQFSNHGGGPRSASNGEKYGRRSMCWDETSGGQTFIKTNDVSTGLNQAGYGTNNKISLIMEDVCLGGSLEEAYELKDYAKYYVGSPNNVPGSGFDYISFVSSLTNGATVEEVGCNLVKTYKRNYEWTSDDWSTFIAKNPKYASYDTLYKSICNTELSTLSFIDLSKINSVKNAVNELAQLIYNDTGAENRIMVDTNTNTLYFLNSNGKYYDNQGNLPPTNAQLYYVYRKFGIKWWTAYYGDPIYYTGSFGCLKDLGAMCAFMRDYYPNWTELNTKANAVTSALSQAIVASWRDGYNAPTYYKIKGESYYDALGSSTDLGAGLTINCSCWVDHQGSDGKTYRYQEFADWYKTDLAFGKDCTNWTNLIESWWGTSN